MPQKVVTSNNVVRGLDGSEFHVLQHHLLLLLDGGWTTKSPSDGNTYSPKISAHKKLSAVV